MQSQVKIIKDKKNQHILTFDAIHCDLWLEIGFVTLPNEKCELVEV